MRFFFFILFLNYCLACTVKKPDNTDTPGTDKVQVAQPTKNLPTVYYKFEELAPIFEQKTDTTYIINFWATWCKPCVKELPYFEQITALYQTEKVKVILVSLDFEQQLETKLLPFMDKHQIQSKVVVLLDPDANAWINRVAPSWSGAIPATLIYNDKKRAFYETSFATLNELEDPLQAFLETKK